MNDITYWKFLLAVYAFCWGAVWGSFLNVVIWRLPRGQNLARPASHCPKCGTPIRPRDNIPLLSWLLLRGRCRHCGTSISARYPLVEALTGVLGAALWWHVAGDRWLMVPFQVLLIPYLFHFFLITALVSIAFIDVDLTIIPHRITIPFMAWGLLGGLLMPKDGIWVNYFPSVDIVDAAIGLVAGGGLIMAVIWGYSLVRGRMGMGDGDAFLLAMIGANLGWQSLVFVLMAASMQGLVAAVVMAVGEKVLQRSGSARRLLLRGAWKDENWKPGEDGVAEHYVAPPAAPEGEADPDEESFFQQGLPFGPFLALAAVEYIFVGEAFMFWVTGGQGL